MDSDLTYTVDGSIGVLRYTRPPVNALRYADLRALESRLSAATESDELALVLETGGDRTFSGGHEVTEFTADDGPSAADATRIYMDVLQAIYEFPVPVIAAVDGPAIGAGAIIASLCDDRVVGPDATFAITEINVGIIGGLGPLKRVLPNGVARRMAYTGDAIDAERAYDLGLASELTADPRTGARELARTIADNSPAAVRAAKASAIDGQPDWPLEEYRREREYIDQLRDGEDATEAAQAFLEDRDPAFDT